MAEEEPGADPAQNDPQGDEPFKSFSSEDDFKQFESKTFSNGYNNYQNKALSRLSEAFGDDVESLDDAISTISTYKEKMSNGIEDPTATTEYKDLQKTNQELKSQIQELESAKKSVEQQYTVDKNINSGLSKLKQTHELKIPEGDVKDLFGTRYKTEEAGGKLIAKQYDESIGDYKPVTDENGNYKPVDQVFADFAKNYADPAKKGTGGEAGAEGGSEKVKMTDYQKAIKENSDRAQKLFEQGQKNGWINDHLPGQ